MNSTIFERNGIVAIASPKGITFKKNGLTMEIPMGFLEEWAEEIDAENLKMLEQIRNFKREKTE